MTPLLRAKLAQVETLPFRHATHRPWSISAKHSHHIGPAHHTIPQPGGLKLSFARGWKTQGALLPSQSAGFQDFSCPSRPPPPPHRLMSSATVEPQQHHSKAGSQLLGRATSSPAQRQQ